MLLEQRERAPGEVVRAERVLEARMRGAGIDEKREAELANVAQPLERRRIDQLEGERIEPDVVPERVADDFDGHGWLTWSAGRLATGCEMIAGRGPETPGPTAVGETSSWTSRRSSHADAHPVAVQGPDTPPPAAPPAISAHRAGAASLEMLHGAGAASLQEQLNVLLAQRVGARNAARMIRGGERIGGHRRSSRASMRRSRRRPATSQRARADRHARQGDPVPQVTRSPQRFRRQWAGEPVSIGRRSRPSSIVVHARRADADLDRRSRAGSGAAREGDRRAAADMVSPRLDRLEQAVDAIAIEVERISEGQRFVTKVLAERPATVRPRPIRRAAMPATQPFRALGAGPIEPIRMPERQAVRQSITPH